MKSSAATWRTLILTSIAAVLAMLMSFTLAWFAQLLVSRDNQIASGVGEQAIELWSQTAADSRFGTEFAPVTDATFDKASEDTLMITRDYLPRADGGLPASTLYLVGDKDGGIFEGPSQTGDWNRILDDGGLLPGGTVTRRVFVRNTSAMSVSYTLRFDPANLGTEDTLIYPANLLSEAVRVDTKLLTPGETEFAPVAKLSAIDGEELQARTISGKVEGNSFDVYELRFTLLSSMSNFYEGASLRLDVRLDAQGGNTIHSIENAGQLSALLGNGNDALRDGETILLMQDITLDGCFITDKMINLNFAGHTLTVGGFFRIEVPPSDGKDPFGTIDIGYGDARGKLVVAGGNGKVGVRAPNCAVRWNDRKDAGFVRYLSNRPDPDALDVRVFNGKEARNPDAVLPGNVVGVSLDKTSLRLNRGESDTLAAVIEPPDALGWGVTWTLSDETVAMVADGVVTGVSAGTATVTATAGGISADCTVTVLPKVGDEYTYQGIQWVVANVSGNQYTLLYHDSPLNPMVWSASNDNKNCDITANQNAAGGLKDLIRAKVPSSTLGVGDVLFLPTTGNVASPSGTANDPDAGQNCWALFQGSDDAARRNLRYQYISSVAGAGQYVWTSTPRAEHATRLWVIDPSGNIYYGTVDATNSFGVVPYITLTL